MLGGWLITRTIADHSGNTSLFVRVWNLHCWYKTAEASESDGSFVISHVILLRVLRFTPTNSIILNIGHLVSQENTILPTRCYLTKSVKNMYRPYFIKAHLMFKIWIVHLSGISAHHVLHNFSYVFSTSTYTDLNNIIPSQVGHEIEFQENNEN